MLPMNPAAPVTSNNLVILDTGDNPNKKTATHAYKPRTDIEKIRTRRRTYSRIGFQSRNSYLTGDELR